MYRKRIVIATGNAGKLKEIRDLLAPLHIEVIPQSEFELPEVEENGLSFIENALIKARHAAHLTGLPAIADDSGLAVDALLGEPGIYSSRFAGEPGNDSANNARLLEDLAEVPASERTARFHCAAVLMTHDRDPAPLVCHATWEGEILTAPRGETGFGYDPVFYVPSQQCSAAELTPETKNRLSHRGQAMRQLTSLIQQRYL
ncbi:MAG: RdgB/HAM1 family non-canonical purine NTP pyrophosphatase [Gammaproteobacteria bacterium]|nr:MAG: RdgB/HAM1 family non-canonical purine NTP pyrophosphatase [Gammaproteobacteria bacterium]